MFVVQLTGSEVEDIRPDIADGVVQVADGLLDARHHAGRIAFDQQAGMFQRQADGINGLDDAVVQVHADAFALFQHRQAPPLYVEAHTFDGSTDPRANGRQELHFQFVQRTRVAGSQTQHAHHALASGDGQAGHLMELFVIYVRVKIAAVRVVHRDQAGLVSLGDFTDHTFTQAVLFLGPQGFDNMPAVHHALEHAAVFRAQIHLANFQLQIIQHLGQRFVQDLIDVGGGGQRGAELVQQRQIFVAAGEDAVALHQLAVDAGVDDGYRGISRQHFDHQLIGFGEFRGANFLGQVNLTDVPPAVANGNAKERFHLGVILGIADAARVFGYGSDADRFLRVHQCPQQSQTARRSWHARHFLFAHAHRDKRFQIAARPDHADSSITRLSLLAG